MLLAARRSARPTARRVATLVALLALGLTTACGGADTGRPAERLSPDVASRADGVTYWDKGDVDLKLDACLPPGKQQKLKAVILAHGGGFTDGSRSEGGMDALCELMADAGIAAFSIDYRLAPDYRYPAQTDDVARAVRWLRQPAQVQRYHLAPAHIGIVGSSAGAILALSTGARGKGSLGTGARVSAVVSLSGVAVLTPDGLTLGQPSSAAKSLISNYLGCESLTENCPQAEPASPIDSVDRTDPPMLLVNGSDELVPSQQTDAMADALQEKGVTHRKVIVDGDSHGVALLDADVRRDIQSFLSKNL